MDIMGLRVRNILSNLFQPSVAPVQQQDNSSSDTNGILQSLLTPNTDISNRLKSQLDSQPHREDFQPTRMEHILHGIQSLSGSGAAGQANGQMIGYKSGGIENLKMREALDGKKFNDVTADWSAKLKPLAELSDAEANQNTQRRIAGSALLRDEANQRGVESREKIAAEKAQIEREKLDEKYYYASIVQEKNMKPNLDRFMDKDGYVYSFDKTTGDIQPLINPETGDKVKGDKLPDAEKLRLQQNNELAKIAARGNQTRQNIAAQGDKEVDVSNRTLDNKKDLKGTTPGRAPTAPRTATEKHKIGDEKVFPNGNVGRWDGVGWVNTGKKAK